MKVSLICLILATIQHSSIAKLSSVATRGLSSNSDTDKNKKRMERRNLKKNKSKGKKKCDPEDVQLSDYPQWQNEVGYWIGQYSFFGADGDPYQPDSWNYPYDHYKGFITGNVERNHYRQRNVFLYPPQTTEICTNDPSVTGEGTCGQNGNSKMFFADQTATTCSLDPEKGGVIEGPYMGVFKTKTELIGRQNALLYQVYLDKDAFDFLEEDVLNQSQLTTIVKNAANETIRVRNAQGFGMDGNPSYASFYRETKVTREQFYAELATTLEQYVILESDTCGGTGIDGCQLHLEQSFSINVETSSDTSTRSSGGELNATYATDITEGEF